jgi:DNA-binding beta-propeller fold protein YncE
MLVTSSAIPGVQTATVTGFVLPSSPGGGVREPKCIDLSGFDKALEELLMLLDGGPVKSVTSGMTRLERSSALAITGDSLDSAKLGFDTKLIEPARNLESLIEGGSALRLRKVLVDRDYTQAYFEDPQVFSFYEDGRLVYSDSGSSKVCVLDEAGALLVSFGGEGDGPGQFRQPSAIEIDRLGRIYVCDRVRGDIQVFDEKGAYRGTLARGLSEPVSMVLWESAKLFVVDRETSIIHVYNVATMKEEATFGGKGTIPGRYIRPNSICIDALGSLLVADSGNDRIQVLNRKGKVEQVWSGIRYPQAVGVSPSNQVYVLCDTIRKYNSNGILLAEWGRAIQFEDGTRYFLGNGINPELRNLLLINDRFYGNILVYEQ